MPARAERGERALGLTVRCVIRQRIIPQEGAMVSGYDPQRGEQVSPGFGVSSMNLYRWKTAAIGCGGV